MSLNATSLNVAYDDELVRLYQGPCQRLDLDGLSVDLVIADPPWGETKHDWLCLPSTAASGSPVKEDTVDSKNPSLCTSTSLTTAVPRVV